MKKIKGILFAAALFFVLELGFASTSSVCAVSMTDDKIANGVYISTVDVSGMTKEEARAAINEYVEGLKQTEIQLNGATGSIRILVDEMGLTAKVDEAVDRAFVVAHSGNLINRFKETKDLEQNNLYVELELSIDKQLTAHAIYDKVDSLNVDAVNNGLKKENNEFVFVPGQTGYEVNIVESVYKISDYITQDWDGNPAELALITDIVEPRGTKEELAQVTDLLGSFTTDFSTSDEGRIKNLTNGSSKLNGTLLYPGEELSVYEICHPFTVENGYGVGGAYQNGVVVDSVGGGICQVSSTLYNAVIRAELEVTMRYSHSMTVSYVEPSDDAAIAGTYKDFRFVNNQDYPIYIEGYCANKKVTFNIYGKETRPSNRTVRFESEIVSQEPATIQFNLNGTLPLGYINVDQGAHLKTSARLWKIVTVDGVEQSREIFNKSSYVGSPRMITVGTAGASAEQLGALGAAVATNDEATVRATVASLAAPAQAAPTVPQETATPAQAEAQTPVE
ncbi:MAG: VanW family protein [Agathobacter sp.]